MEWKLETKGEEGGSKMMRRVWKCGEKTESKELEEPWGRSGRTIAK